MYPTGKITTANLHRNVSERAPKCELDWGERGLSRGGMRKKQNRETEKKLEQHVEISRRDYFSRVIYTETHYARPQDSHMTARYGA